MTASGSKSSHGFGISTMSCICLLLWFSGTASARFFNWRQEAGLSQTSASGNVATASSATEAGSSTVIATNSPAVSTATGTRSEASATSMGAAPTTASNETSATNSTSSALAVATSSDYSSHLNSTNDPNECHISDPEPGRESPFCKPAQNQTLAVGQEFQVTWDPSPFDPNSTNKISVVRYEDASPDETDSPTPLFEQNVSNSQGSTFLIMSSKWLDNKSTANLSLYLHNDNDTQYRPGTVIHLTKNLNASFPTSSSSSKNSNSKDLGEKVGIPIGMVFLIGAVALIAAYICMRKRRGLGYGASKAARTQHMPPAAPVTGRSHRRDPSFHDEPTRGMELQNRVSRSTTNDDNWDWGSPVSSPTTGGRNSNAFREEIERQKSGRRA